MFINDPKRIDNTYIITPDKYKYKYRLTIIIQRGYTSIMTTLKDYARDLVLETIKVLVEKKNPDILNSEINDLIDKEITAHEVDDLVDEFIENIKNRLIGE